MRKTTLIIIFSALLFMGCKQTKQDTIEDLLTATNKFDKEKVGQLLSDSLIYIDENGKSYRKVGYLQLIDSLKKFEIKSEIISIIEKDDSTLRTTEKYTTILDTLLLKDDTAKFTISKDYLVRDGKVITIIVDTNGINKKFSESLNDRINILFLFAEDKHNEKDKETILKNIKEYLSEYSKLSTSEKKAYRYYSYIQGTFAIDKSSLEKNNNSDNSTNNTFKDFSRIMVACSYLKLTFKGKRSVVAYQTLFGVLQYETVLTYELDDNYIRIIGEGGKVFLLKILDKNTLKSEEYDLIYNRIKAKNK